MWPVLIPEEHPHSAGKVSSALGPSQPGQNGGSDTETENGAGGQPEPPASHPLGNSSL